MILFTLMLQASTAVLPSQFSVGGESVGVFTCNVGPVASNAAIEDDTPIKLDRTFTIRILSFNTKFESSESSPSMTMDGFEISDPTDILIGFGKTGLKIDGSKRSLTIVNIIDENHSSTIQIAADRRSTDGFKFNSFYAKQEKFSENNSRTTLYSVGRLVGNCGLTLTETTKLLPSKHK